MLTSDAQALAAAERHARIIRLTHIVAFIALLVSIALLLLYLGVFYRSSFFSDDAVASMLGEAMWQQGRLIPVGWINFNGDLMIPSAALIVAPLLRWFPNGYAVHAAASFFAVAFLLGSVAYCLKTLRIPLAICLLVLTFLAAGVSFDFMTMVYAQTTYVWWSAGFCLVAGLMVGARDRLQPSGRFPLGHAIAIGIVVFCIAFANPTRVFLMMVLPLYAFDRVFANAHLSTDYARAPNLWRRATLALGLRDRLTLCSLIAPWVLAAIAYVGLMQAGITEGVHGVTSFLWESIDSVWRHIGTFRSWFGYLGGEIHGRDLNPLAFAALRPFRFFLAVAVTAIGFYEVCRLRWTTEASRRALAIALVVAFVPIFAVYALFEPFAVNGGSLRYFMVPIIIIIVLPVFVLRHALARWPLFAHGALAIACCLLTAIAAQRFLPFWVFHAGLHDAVAPSARMKLADGLQRAGLRWGYASWLNAGATTVLSDSNVRVTPVRLATDGKVYAWRFMVLKDWYRPSAWSGPTFLALDAKDGAQYPIDQWKLSLGEPKQVLDIPPYTVLVFDHNIARDFCCGRRAAMHESPAQEAPKARLASAQRDARLDPDINGYSQ